MFGGRLDLAAALTCQVVSTCRSCAAPVADEANKRCFSSPAAYLARCADSSVCGCHRRCSSNSRSASAEASVSVSYACASAESISGQELCSVSYIIISPMRQPGSCAPSCASSWATYPLLPQPIYVNNTRGNQVWW